MKRFIFSVIIILMTSGICIADDTPTHLLPPDGPIRKVLRGTVVWAGGVIKSIFTCPGKVPQQPLIPPINPYPNEIPPPAEQGVVIWDSNGYYYLK